MRWNYSKIQINYDLWLRRRIRQILGVVLIVVILNVVGGLGFFKIPTLWILEWRQSTRKMLFEAASRQVNQGRQLKDLEAENLKLKQKLVGLDKNTATMKLVIGEGEAWLINPLSSNQLNMGVYNVEGRVVGQVKSLGKWQNGIKLVTDEGFKLAVTDETRTLVGIYTVLLGNKTVKRLSGPIIERGTMIITSGLDDWFAPGMLVGVATGEKLNGIDDYVLVVNKVAGGDVWVK